MLEKIYLFLSILFKISIYSMLERTEKISLRISSVLPKVEPELDLHTGSDQKYPDSTTLRATAAGWLLAAAVEYAINSKT